VATLVPVAGTAAADLLGPDETRSGGSSITGRKGPAVRRARSRRTRWLALMAAADVASVVVVGALVTVTATPVAPVVLLVVALLWTCLLLVAHGYDAVPHDSLRGRGRAVVRAGAALGLCCWVLPTVADPTVMPAQLMMVTVALTSLALSNRLAADGWAARAADLYGGVRTLVAGDPEAVARAVSELRRVAGRRWNVVSVCVTEPSGDIALDVPVTFGVDDLAGVAAACRAEAVLLLPCRQVDPVRLRRLGWQLEATRTRLYVGTGLLDVAPARASVVSVGDLGVVQLRPAPTRSPARAAKQVVERLGAAVLLVVLLPVLVAVAIAIRRDSPGPALFQQRRVGRDGVEFTMYKFRTMTINAESRVADLTEHNESDGAMLFKIRQDPRITRLGGLLRRYSIDELPQLANVVLGHMALVGPRPALPDEVSRYDVDPRRRLAVRPGLTGLWQVSGRSDLSWDDTVRLDLHYVDNWSLSLDLQIACRTVRAVLGHDGAY
jgi:exopolysaccharide biosynthesis polyprenyl glycosylphosphotransferase